MGFSLIFFFILVRIANKYLDKELPPIPNNNNNNLIVNYYPLVFHLTIIILLLISCFTKSIMSEERIHALVADGFFQFHLTALVLIISFINPFLPISDETRSKIDEVGNENEILDWVLKGKNWQLIKLLICLIIVCSFILSGYLKFPSMNQGIISGVIVVLIVFFIFGCAVELIRNPVLFRKQTMFRLSMLYRSIKTSFFISLGLCLTVFLLTIMLDLKIRESINYEGIILFVYNIVMAFNEYKIMEAKRSMVLS